MQTLVRFLVARWLQSRFESAKHSLDMLFQKRLFLAHASTYLLRYLESSVPEAFLRVLDQRVFPLWLLFWKGPWEQTV